MPSKRLNENLAPEVRTFVTEPGLFRWINSSYITIARNSIQWIFYCSKINVEGSYYSHGCVVKSPIMSELSEHRNLDYTLTDDNSYSTLKAFLNRHDRIQKISFITIFFFLETKTTGERRRNQAIEAEKQNSRKRRKKGEQTKEGRKWGFKRKEGLTCQSYKSVVI